MTTSPKEPRMNPRVLERLMVGVFVLVTILVVAGVLTQRIDITTVALGLLTFLGTLTTLYFKQMNGKDDEP